jgi:hypothetical protein
MPMLGDMSIHPISAEDHRSERFIEQNFTTPMLRHAIKNTREKVSPRLASCHDDFIQAGKLYACQVQISVYVVEQQIVMRPDVVYS